MIDKLIKLFKIYRGSGYTRIALYALSLPALLFTPSLIDLLALFLMDQLLIGSDYSNSFYGLLITLSIFAFYIICFLIDSNYNPSKDTNVENVEEYKLEQDRKVVKQILSIFQYQKTKRNLESARNGVDWDFITDLETAEYFLSPKYNLHNKEVEKAKNKFLSSVMSYFYFLKNHVHPSGNRTDYFSIPKEWLHNGNYDRYKDSEKKISEESKKVFKNYQKFYELAKENLLVEAT